MNTLDLVPPYRPAKPPRPVGAGGIEPSIPEDTYTRVDLEEARRKAADYRRKQRRAEGVEPRDIDVFARLADIVVARRQPWRQQAACLGLDTDLFFPASNATADAGHAKKVCRSCPVRQQCLDEFIDQQHGIFADTSPKERRRLRRERAERAAQQADSEGVA